MVRICCGNKLSNNGENSSGGVNFSRPWSPPNKKRQLRQKINKHKIIRTIFKKKLEPMTEKELLSQYFPLKVVEYLEVSGTTAVGLFLVKRLNRQQEFFQEGGKKCFLYVKERYLLKLTYFLYVSQ